MSLKPAVAETVHLSLLVFLASSLTALRFSNGQRAFTAVGETRRSLTGEEEHTNTKGPTAKGVRQTETTH